MSPIEFSIFIDPQSLTLTKFEMLDGEKAVSSVPSMVLTGPITPIDILDRAVTGHQ